MAGLDEQLLPEDYPEPSFLEPDYPEPDYEFTQRRQPFDPDKLSTEEAGQFWSGVYTVGLWLVDGDQPALNYLAGLVDKIVKADQIDDTDKHAKAHMELIATVIGHAYISGLSKLGFVDLVSPEGQAILSELESADDN